MITINAAKTKDSLSVIASGDNSYNRSSIYCPVYGSCNVYTHPDASATFVDAIISAQSTTSVLNVTLNAAASITPKLTIICPDPSIATTKCIFSHNATKALYRNISTSTIDHTSIHPKDKSEYQCNQTDKCTGEVLQCAERNECNIYCDNTNNNKSDSCWHSLFICPMDYDCNIHCSGTQNVCKYLNIIGGKYGNLSIEFTTTLDPGSTNLNSVFCPLIGSCTLLNVPFVRTANIIANETTSFLNVSLISPPDGNTRIKCPDTRCDVYWSGTFKKLITSMSLFVYDMQTGWSVSGKGLAGSSEQGIQLFCISNDTIICNDLEIYNTQRHESQFLIGYVKCISSETCSTLSTRPTLSTSLSPAPTSGFYTTNNSAFAPSLPAITSYPTQATFIQWLMEMKYNIDYQTFLGWINDQNTSPTEWARDFIKALIEGSEDSSEEYNGISISIRSVEPGSVIIKYLMESKSISLLNDALKRIETNSHRDGFVINIDGRIYLPEYNKQIVAESESDESDTSVMILVAVSSVLFLVIVVFAIYCLKNHRPKQECMPSEDIKAAPAMSTPKAHDQDSIQEVQLSENNIAHQKENENEELKNWLDGMQLGDMYYEKFVEHGYGKQMSALSELNDDDLKRIGVTLETDRVRLLTEIRLLNNKEGDETQIDVDMDEVPEGGDVTNNNQINAQKSIESDQHSDEDMY